MFTVAQWLLIAFAFVAAWVGTAWVGHWVVRKKLLDMPNHRSSHLEATPRGGGLSIVIVFTFITGLLFMSDSGMAMSVQMVNVFVTGGLAIAITGWLDDHWRLSPIIRITVHFAVALYCLALLGVPSLPILGSSLSLEWYGYLLAAIALVWCLNFFNFMDGIDGIASVQAITMALSAALILIFAAPNSVFTLYLLVFIAAVGGFLVWNWSPAKIFMGDTGSGFLGFTLGLFAIATSVEESMNIWSWLILFGVFGIDATVVLLLRFLRKETFYHAHCQHAYQRLAINLQRTESIMRSPKYARAAAHQAVTLITAGINLLWLLPWAFVAALDASNGIIYLIIALLPLAVAVIKAQHIEGTKMDFHGSA